VDIKIGECEGEGDSGGSEGRKEGK